MIFCNAPISLWYKPLGFGYILPLYYTIFIPFLHASDKEKHEEEQALSQYGSSDSGASLGDILGDALNKKSSN